MRLPITFLALLVVAACQSTSGPREPTPAVLIDPDEAVQAELKQRVSKAVEAETLISADALTQSHVLIVERRPYQQLDNQVAEGRIMERPNHFELYRHGEQCILRHRQSQEEWELKHAHCRVQEKTPAD